MANIRQHALITGGAGFIGSNLADELLQNDWNVTVIDNFDEYYSPALKHQNISYHLSNPNYRLVQGDILEVELYDQLTDDYDVIIHLAARAGVRPSIKAPTEYVKTNIMGTQNLLEFAREKDIRQFVFASSSSVYGINPNFPWKESDYILQPISPYASTKVSGELTGHVYSHLYGIRFIALRFFTVFGPRQRPDLAINKFVRLIRDGSPITMFGDGSTKRDYTFVKDIVQGVIAAINYTDSMYEIINLGNGNAISLAEMIRTIESVVGKEAIIEQLPEQPGDVPITYSDISKASKLLGYNPGTSFEQGVRAFQEWMLNNTKEFTRK